MTPREAVALVLLVAGAGFFLAGTIGLVRFPDPATKLHAVTKADNVGLGLVVLGLVVLAPSVAVAAKLVATWLLALSASGTACYLLAGRAVAEADPGRRSRQ
jgi:multicomponent Na+:H+ antiporter subunit G